MPTLQEYIERRSIARPSATSFLRRGGTRGALSGRGQSFKEFLTKPRQVPRPLGRIVRALQPRNILRTSLMLYPGNYMAGFGQKVGAGFKAVGTYFRGVPSGTKVGTYLKNLAIRGGLFGAVSGTAFLVSRKVAQSNLPTDVKVGVAAGTSAVSPFGLIGSAYGAGNKLFDAIFTKSKDLISKVPDVVTTPSVAFPEISFPEINYPDFNVTLPQTPSLPTSAGSSISVYGGGGGIDPALLALLLVGGGAGAGYLLGRRRRKRKYKKRRKLRR